MRQHFTQCVFKTLRLTQNGHHFADNIFKCIFLNENPWISFKISSKFVPKGPINNIPWLVQIMAWPRPGRKPLSAPLVVRLLTHVCITRPKWVKGQNVLSFQLLPKFMAIHWCWLSYQIWYLSSSISYDFINFFFWQTLVPPPINVCACKIRYISTHFFPLSFSLEF